MEIDGIPNLWTRAMTEAEMPKMRDADAPTRCPFRHPERVTPGNRVRTHRTRAEAVDVALAGREAVIEAIAQDAEGHVRAAVVRPDDPGRDLGITHLHGHRPCHWLEEPEGSAPMFGTRMAELWS